MKKGGIRLLEQAALVAAAAGLATPAIAHVDAGAGQATVQLTMAMLPLDDFTSIHDPLRARVLLFRDAAGRVALVEVDETSLNGEVVDELKQTVAHATGAKTADVLVIASHTFSAPHLFGGAHLPPGVTMSGEQQARAEAYHRAVLTAASQAAETAVKKLEPARLRFGEGVADVNVNRNVAMADGWWLGADDAGYSDKTVDLVRIDDTKGRPIAFLGSYPVQSSVMDHSVGAGGGKGVTADVLGAASGHVERVLGEGAVAMLITGAAGDQAPGYTARTNRYDKDGRYRTVDIGDAGYGLLGPQGARLGEAVVRVAQGASPIEDDGSLRVFSGSVSLPTQNRPDNLQQIKPTQTYSFISKGRVEAPFTVMQVGNTVLVGVQAELSSSTGVYIRKHSPFAHTMVATMVNGAAKYMPEADDYRKITYEAMNSPYAAGAAETFAGAIIAALKALQKPSHT